jgi:CRISPR-associated protein Cas2
VAYDISDDPRRTRIAKCLEGYGDRVQYSVFVVDVRPARLVRLRTKLEALIDPVTDSILLCDLGPVSSLDVRRFEFLGCAASIMPNGPIVL